MIVKMSGWVSPPQPQDYDAIIGNISALNRAVFGQRVIITEYNSLLLPRLSVGSVIQHGGVLYVVQEEEYEISGSVSQGVNYIRVATDGETLAVEWVTSRNGYSWNPVYGYLADGSGRQLLPYKVVRDGDDYEKSHLSEMGIWAGGKIEGESINTGQGPVKLNQNLRTTDNPTFATINTGQGAVEAYPMNQAVRTTDDVIFSSAKLNQVQLDVSSGNGLVLLNVSAGTDTLLGKGSSGFSSNTGYVKVSEVTIQAQGTVTVSFRLSSSGNTYVDARVYINGVAKGTERATTSEGTYSQNFTISAGDKVQIYAKRRGVANANITDFTVKCSAVFPWHS